MSATSHAGEGRARLAGVVLAGGHSTRFGRDKALATLGGRTLLDRAVSCLRGVCDGRVLVSSGDGISRPLVADGQIADVVPEGGPLAGIAAALLALRDEASAVAVLAVDHVAPSAALLALLAQRRDDAACATVIVGEWLQPLHAVWSTDVADDVTAAVTGGVSSPSAWLAGRDDVVVLDEATVRSVGLDPAATRDADVPDDLRL